MWIPTRILFGADELKTCTGRRCPGKRRCWQFRTASRPEPNGYLAAHGGTAPAGRDRKRGIRPDRSEPLEIHRHGRSGSGTGARVRHDRRIGRRQRHGRRKGHSPDGIQRRRPVGLCIRRDGQRTAGRTRTAAVIAITTTAGTGSEVDPWGVVTNEQTHEKIGVEAAFPVLAVVDPKLMLTVPPKFTAYQGFDALFHSVESYISKFANLASDMYALTAIEHIARNLPRAVANGDDLEARTRVAFGNTLSGVVMCLSATTSQHSMEHAMSAYHQDLPHGAGLIMLSRAYFSFFIDRARLRRAFRTDGPCNGDGAGRTARRFHHGAHPLATGMRRRRPEDVRLRHHPGEL